MSDIYGELSACKKCMSSEQSSDPGSRYSFLIMKIFLHQIVRIIRVFVTNNVVNVAEYY